MDSVKYRQSMLTDDGESRAQAGGLMDMLKGEKKQPKKTEKKKNTATEGSRRVKKEKKRERVKEKQEDTCTQTQALSMAPQAPQAVGAAQAANAGQANEMAKKWIIRTLDVGVEGLRDEFRTLAKYTKPGMTSEQFTKFCNPDINVTKNRYQDVPCQDQSAVTLQPPAPCPYIHANYVPTPMSETRFICTQGPLEQTIEDFWWMIVQQKVEQIVMLCKVVEMGKLKCAQYWPAAMGEKKEFNGSKLVVENVSGTSPLERDKLIAVTQLKVTVDGQSISVRHLHWTDWPDRGVPVCDPDQLTSLELLSAVRGSKAPIVVHCSAGIGRTGTIVAMEYILEKISLPGDELKPMPELIRYIRDHRAFSVQNDLQYLYIHRVMLYYFLHKYALKYASVLKSCAVSLDKFNNEYKVAVGQ